jgi:hypothetical protein
MNGWGLNAEIFRIGIDGAELRRKMKEGDKA